MSALPKSSPSSRRRSSRPVRFSPSDRPLPTSLQVLLQFQQTTSWITLGVVGAVLGFYGWTVYTPVQWSQAYQKLQALQKTERQLVANTEAIKHQLAQEADSPKSGLIPPNPSLNLFLPAVPPSGEKAPKATPVVHSQAPVTYPVAY